MNNYQVTMLMDHVDNISPLTYFENGKLIEFKILSLIQFKIRREYKNEKDENLKNKKHNICYIIQFFK